MAKQKTVYCCSECGNESPNWSGKCSACGSWIHSSFAQNGVEYHYYETTHEYGYNGLIWSRNGYHFMLSSQLELEELVKIAENIK